MSKLQAVVVMLVLSALACGGASTATSEPKAAVGPISSAEALSTADICAAIPKEDIEAVMGRKLSQAPKAFTYYDAPGTNGCWYEAAKGADGEAHFGYVVFTPVADYNDQPLYLDTNVSGIGQSAYFNNGADARQLWVKVSDTLAFVVAFGDVPREDGAQALARLVVAAIQ